MRARRDGPKAPSGGTRFERGRWSSARMRETFAGYGFLGPNFLGFLLFVSVPIAASLFFSFTEYNILQPPRWVGLRNYADVLWFHWEDAPVTREVTLDTGEKARVPIVDEVLQPDGTTRRVARTARRLAANDSRFWYYCYNTVFLMLGLPLGMAVSLAMALLMNQKIRGITFWRTVFFLPSVTAGVAVYLLWMWIYDPENGLLNHFLSASFSWIGLFPKDPSEWPRWLMSAGLAKPSLIVMGLWIGAGGFNMVLFLAALQGVDPQLYEAAMIDGATAWQKFRHITWPLISPTTFFILVMGIIWGFQGGFMQAYVMTEGGPQGATTTLSYYIFNNAYTWFNLGKAAAVAWFLFVVVLALTLVNWRFGGRKVNY